VETHMVPRDPSDAICETARAVEADLIVVGNRGMKGMRRVLGSVPNSVAHHAPCDVLIVETKT
jgi:nucleotide-binding universal stress UspA family protein